MRSPAFAEGLWEPVEHSFNALPGTVCNSVLAITFHRCRAFRSDASERSGPALVFPGHGVVQSPTDVCDLLDSQDYTGAFPKPSLPLPVAAWLPCFVLLSRWGHHRVGEWGMSSWTTTKIHVSGTFPWIVAVFGYFPEFWKGWFWPLLSVLSLVSYTSRPPPNVPVAKPPASTASALVAQRPGRRKSLSCNFCSTGFTAHH